MGVHLFLAGTVLLGLTSAIDKCPGQFPSHVHTEIFKGKCYAFYRSNDKEKFHDAESRCEVHGGTLAMPKTQEINAYLGEALRLRVGSPYRYWIGLTDEREEGVYAWVDGTKPSYSRFRLGQGSRQLPTTTPLEEDCIAMDYDGHWHDYSCGKSVHTTYAPRKNFICEFDSSALSTTPETSTDSISTSEIAYTAEITTGIPRRTRLTDTTFIAETTRVGTTTIPHTTEAGTTSVTDTTQAETTAVPDTTQAETTPEPDTTHADTTSVPDTTQADTTSVPDTTQADTTSVPDTTQADTTSVPDTTQAETTSVPDTTQADTSSVP